MSFVVSFKMIDSSFEIGIGVVTEILSLIPSLLIVQFFRRIRSRQQHSPIRQILNKVNPSTHMSVDLPTNFFAQKSIFFLSERIQQRTKRKKIRLS